MYIYMILYYIYDIVVQQECNGNVNVLYKNLENISLYTKI